jgi:hypothetical protein
MVKENSAQDFAELERTYYGVDESSDAQLKIKDGGSRDFSKQIGASNVVSQNCPSKQYR